MYADGPVWGAVLEVAEGHLSRSLYTTALVTSNPRPSFRRQATRQSDTTGLTQFSDIREVLLQEESAAGSVRQRPYQERQADVIAVGKGHVAVIKLLVERRQPAVAHSCD